MALFDLDNLKKGAQKSAAFMKKTLSEASEKLPDNIKDLADKLPDNLKEIDVEDSVKKIAKKGQDAFEVIKAKGEEAIATHKEKQGQKKAAVSEALKDEDDKEIILSIPDALEIVYCFMAVDGVISGEEEIRFTEVGKELDPEFDQHRNELMLTGNRLLETSAAYEEDYYDSIHDHVGNLILRSAEKDGSGIRGKVLVWDLLTIAYAEGHYSENEKRLMRYIAKTLGVDHTTLLELEHALRTLLAIENEEAWLKGTDRQYAVVQERVNELADRKMAVMSGVNALIAD